MSNSLGQLTPLSFIRVGVVLTCQVALPTYPTLLTAAPVKEDSEHPHLKIQIDERFCKAPSSTKDHPKFRQNWLVACNQIGKNILTSQGPWGFGVFGSYSCHCAKNKMSGTDKISLWSLNIKQAGLNTVFTLQRSDTMMSSIKMITAKSLARFFGDDEFSDLVTYSLLEQLPFAIFMNEDMLKTGSPRISFRTWRRGKSNEFKYKIQDPPKMLTLFRLKPDAYAQWNADPVGHAKLIENANKPEDLHPVVTYELDKKALAAIENGPLWAQSEAGPGHDKQLLQKSIDESIPTLNEAAKNGQLPDYLDGSTPKPMLAYAGLRYGLQVLPGKGELKKVLSKTSRLSLLLEVTGGPLKGLRYYYDKTPKASANLDGTEGQSFKASLEMSRHTIGCSFGLNLNFLLNRATFDPKIGVWEFNADLPIDYDTDGTVTQMQTFNLGRSMSTGAEIGIERLTKVYTLRFWYGIDTGFSLLKNGGRITSNRLGIDAYFTAGPTFDLYGRVFKSAILLFYMFENVSMVPGKLEDPAPGQAMVQQFSYNSGFAGAGLAISW